MDAIHGLEYFLANSRLMPELKRIILKKIYFISEDQLIWRRILDHEIHVLNKIQPRYKRALYIHFTHSLNHVSSLQIMFNDASSIVYYNGSSFGHVSDCMFYDDYYDIDYYKNTIKVNERCFINECGDIDIMGFNINRYTMDMKLDELNERFNLNTIE